MEEATDLQGKLGNIERGARSFQILAVVLLVIGCVGLGGGALQLLALLGRHAVWTDVLADTARTAFGALQYFLLAFLARRAADGFATIGELIREIGEIV